LGSFFATANGFAAGIVGGFYFAFTCTRWRRESLGRAFWMTTGQHFLHNAFACAIALMAMACS